MANPNIDPASATVITSLPYTVSALDVLDVIGTGGTLWYKYVPQSAEMVVGALATSAQASAPPVWEDDFESGEPLSAHYEGIYQTETEAASGALGGWGVRTLGVLPSPGRFSYRLPTPIAGSYCKVEIDLDSSNAGSSEFLTLRDTYDQVSGYDCVYVGRSLNTPRDIFIGIWDQGEVAWSNANQWGPIGKWQTFCVEVWMSSGGGIGIAANPDGRVRVTIDGLVAKDATGLRIQTRDRFQNGTANLIGWVHLDPGGRCDNLKIWDQPSEDFRPYLYGWWGTASSLVEIQWGDLGWTYENWRCVAEFPVNQPGEADSHVLFIAITHDTWYGTLYPPEELSRATLTFKVVAAPRRRAPIGSLIHPDWSKMPHAITSATDGTVLRFAQTVDADGVALDSWCADVLPNGISCWVEMRTIEFFSPQLVSIARIVYPPSPYKTEQWGVTQDGVSAFYVSTREDTSYGVEKYSDAGVLLGHWLFKTPSGIPQFNGHSGAMCGWAASPDGSCLYTAWVTSGIERFDLTTSTFTEIVPLYGGHTGGGDDYLCGWDSLILLADGTLVVGWYMNGGGAPTHVQRYTTAGVLLGEHVFSGVYYEHYYGMYGIRVSEDPGYFWVHHQYDEGYDLDAFRTIVGTWDLMRASDMSVVRTFQYEMYDNGSGRIERTPDDPVLFRPGGESIPYVIREAIGEYTWVDIADYVTVELDSTEFINGVATVRVATWAGTAGVPVQVRLQNVTDDVTVATGEAVTSTTPSTQVFTATLTPGVKRYRLQVSAEEFGVDVFAMGQIQVPRVSVLASPSASPSRSPSMSPSASPSASPSMSWTTYLYETFESGAPLHNLVASVYGEHGDPGWGSIYQCTVGYEANVLAGAGKNGTYGLGAIPGQESSGGWWVIFQHTASPGEPGVLQPIEDAGIGRIQFDLKLHDATWDVAGGNTVQLFDLSRGWYDGTVCLGVFLSNETAITGGGWKWYLMGSLGDGTPNSHPTQHVNVYNPMFSCAASDLSDGAFHTIEVTWRAGTVTQWTAYNNMTILSDGWIKLSIDGATVLYEQNISLIVNEDGQYSDAGTGSYHTSSAVVNRFTAVMLGSAGPYPGVYDNLLVGAWD